MTVEDEARAAYAAYCETRSRIVAGELPWTALEAIAESGCAPSGAFNMPSEHPERDTSLPAHRADLTDDPL